MVNDVLSEAMGGLLTLWVVFILQKSQPLARRCWNGLWRKVRKSLSDDYARFKSLSRRRKFVYAAYNIYCVGALITGNVFEPDTAPLAVQIWVSSLFFIIVAGLAWLAMRRVVRTTRRLFA